MKTPTLYNDDGSETPLPFVWQICGGCDGHGKSSAHLGAFTQSEMDAQGPEFFEDYMAGAYDAPCICCAGAGKIKVVHYARLTTAQRKAWNAQRRADREYAAEIAAERRAGC